MPLHHAACTAKAQHYYHYTGIPLTSSADTPIAWEQLDFNQASASAGRYELQQVTNEQSINFRGLADRDGANQRHSRDRADEVQNNATAGWQVLSKTHKRMVGEPVTVNNLACMLEFHTQPQAR